MNLFSWMTFGVKEARAASTIATTSEQRQTVLAVLKALGVRIVLSDEVGRKVTTSLRKLDRVAKRAGCYLEKFKKTNEKYEIEQREMKALESLRDNWSE